MAIRTEKTALEDGTFESGKETLYNSSIPSTRGNVKYRYIGAGKDSGSVIEPEEAMEYALKKCGIKIINPCAPEYKEFIDMLEEWFFQLWEKEEAYEAGA